MLHLVFKSAKFWAGAFVWMLFAALCIIGGPARATTATATVGVDAWHVPEASARYLPNYSLPEGHTWQPISHWARGTLQHQVETDLGPVVLTAQGQYNRLVGHRIDRLDAAMRVTDSAGVRVGVLPYKVSWCRTYDNTSPWLSEPDAFCRFHGLNEIAQSSFGAQTYHSALVQGWLLDTMVGVYRPEIDGQSKALGPYVAVGPTTLHKKVGASVNALHLASGIQARAAWLNTLQNQKSDAGSYERRLDYDTYYFAVEGNASPKLNLRGSLSAYIGHQNNPALPYEWDGRSTTIEAIYKPVSGHSVALGVSKYTNITTYSKAPNRQRLEVPSVSLAWRTDWADGIHTVVQATRTVDESTTRQGTTTNRSGNAVGVRLAKTF
jgi:hypothetical protein